MQSARRRRHGDHRRVHDQLGRAAVVATWQQHHRRVPELSVGVTYLPIPVGGVITLLFIIERLWLGEPPRDLVHVPRPAAGWNRAPMDALDPAGLVPGADVRSACRSPTRWASPRCSSALWIDIPLEAVMLKISDGIDDFALLAIPFFVLAGAIMAEGGVARAPGRCSPRCSSASSAAAWRWSTCSPRRLFGCLSGSSVADTASIGSVMIPQMVSNGYSEGVRHQRHHLRLGAGDPGPALAQRGDLFASPPAARCRSRRCSWRACSRACCSAPA